MTKRLFLSFLLLFLLCFLNGQNTLTKNSVKNDPGFINIISYGLDLPAGNMRDLYGYNFRFGIAPTYYFANSNFSIGFSADYIFGYKVKINPVSNLQTYDEQILNSGPGISSFNMTERGIVAGAFVSKVFPFKSHNLRTGIRIDFGPYFFSHWIHYKDDLGTIPQLEGEYRKGYDRLTGGFALKEFIGYQHLSQKSNVSFNAGFEFFQGFTKSFRLHNFSNASTDNEKKIDLLFGIKIGWILPIYIEKNPEEIYY